MKTKILKWAAVLLVVAVGIFASCEEKENTNTNTKVGIIYYAAPPDNCNDYVIDFNLDEELNDLHKPNNLPNEFKVDSLKVEVNYRTTNEQHSCGFGGSIPVINIVEIKAKEELSTVEEWAIRIKLKPQTDTTYVVTEDPEIKILLLRHDLTMKQSTPGAKTPELLLYYDLKGKNSNKENAMKDFLATGKFEDEIYEYETAYTTN